MRIIVFGANGRQGSRLVTEALERGHDVTAAVRSADRAHGIDPRATVVVADALDPARVAQVSAGHDAAINATRERHADIARALLEGLSRAGVKRLIVVGGASSLEVAPGVRLFDTPVEWTYVSPGALLEPGERTGSYRTGTEQLLVADDGRSRISMEDFAVALLDEAERPQHSNRRFTAAY